MHAHRYFLPLLCDATYTIVHHQAALSKKISEYHRIGFIDNLIDIHFADAHCIKKRISEEDSQLEVSHHAGRALRCPGVCEGNLMSVRVSWCL